VSTRGTFPAAVVTALVLGPLLACDPVTDDAIAALGPEAPGVRRGPLHRPGQPCLLCHDGAIGDPPEFVVAGTIYARPESAVGLANAVVTMHDATGSMHEATTNAAGNFYLTPQEWAPVFPLHGITVQSALYGFMVRMQSSVGRDGGCASCHVAPAGPGSPGRVVFEENNGTVPP